MDEYNEQIKLELEKYEQREQAALRQSKQIDDITLDKLFERLIKAKDGIVCANIMASHGQLMGGEPIKMNYDKLRLFVIASRGYLQLGGSSLNYLIHLKGSLHYLKQLTEGIEEEALGQRFHDDYGCLTELGEKTLANMIFSMVGQRTPSRHPQAAAKRHWTVYKKDAEWSTPFLTLKIYNNKYNNHVFYINEALKTRFGILFQYRDNDDNSIKTVFLDLRNLVSKAESEGLKYVLLSEVFETLTPLFTQSMESELQFNFTHMSCRVDYTSPGSLTRQFSNQGSELSSKHCFIKKFKEEYREELENKLIGFDTIYEFYNKLKDEKKYDEFLDLLNEKENGIVGADYNLFRFIIGFLEEGERKKGRKKEELDMMIQQQIERMKHITELESQSLDYLLELAHDFRIDEYSKEFTDYLELINPWGGDDEEARKKALANFILIEIQRHQGSAVGRGGGGQTKSKRKRSKKRKINRKKNKTMKGFKKKRTRR